VQQLMIGPGPQLLSTVPVIQQAAHGEHSPPVQLLQAVKRGQCHAKTAIQVLQGLKQLGFQVWIGLALGLRLMLRLKRLRLGLRLRRMDRAFTFTCSHRCLLK
jgi:hypothetical protein